jgi:hypothetical protein
VILLLVGVLVSWLLAMDERCGYEDLRGLGCRSIIPYIHERTELYYSSLPWLSQPFSSAPVKWRLSEPFIAQGQAVTLRPRA